MSDWEVDWEVDGIEDPEADKIKEQHRKHNEAMQKHVSTMMDMVGEAREMLREAKSAARDAETAAKHAEKMAGETSQSFQASSAKSKESLDSHGNLLTSAAGEAKNSSAAAGEAKKLAEASAKSAAMAEKMADKVNNSVAALKAYVEGVAAKAEAKLSVIEERMKAHEEIIKHLASMPREAATTVVQSDDGGKYADLGEKIASAISAAMTRPRKIVRDKNGYAMGIE